MSVRATVRNGRLTLDEPTELPEGTVLDLVIDDEGDELSPTDGVALEAAIARSLDQADHGLSAPAEDVLARLRARRRG